MVSIIKLYYIHRCSRKIFHVSIKLFAGLSLQLCRDLFSITTSGKTHGFWFFESRTFQSMSSTSSISIHANADLPNNVKVDRPTQQDAELLNSRWNDIGNISLVDSIALYAGKI